MQNRKSMTGTSVFHALQSQDCQLDWHHPGYHRLVAQSWWCDHCLQTCRAMQSISFAEAGHWYDFWSWLAGLLAQGTAALLGAAFAIVSYLIGGFTPKQPPLTPAEARWQRELQWLLAYRERILYGIDKYRSDRVKASVDGGRPTVFELSELIRSAQEELERTNVEIKKMQDLLADKEQRPLQWIVPGEYNSR